MKSRVAINGFGRIGRMVFRKAITEESLDVIAINASYPPATLSHLIKYDSIHGTFDGEVTPVENGIKINGKEIKVISDRDPSNLPWKDLNIDIVIEATGKFNSRDGAGLHLDAGAKKVIITAPGKNEDLTVVMGINESEYKHEKHHVISNASCTTNCLAPVVKVLDKSFGIVTGMMTTVHAYTNDQKNIDNPHKDLRRARACGQSIIPTTTGAAKAISKVLPHLEGKLNGMSLRVPTPNVSLVDLVVDLKKDVTVEEVNDALKAASEGPLRGILGYSDEPLVSIDYNGDSNSSIVDGLSTMVVEKNKVKVLAWYDNEWGYSCRVVDMAKYVGEKIPSKSEVSV
ncbi:glyceraldehyde-3-phosphate dehydrogenase [Alkalihalobacillus sp. CinArs1]|uniref:glyceraldehyde-3-phosphate dehydrogenase n=1 Tax=Alkalihalobacillus sp. CinArs1 TaxID=2995314 RepID=UPI0022DD59E2|nr:glyceraldehyde-3-phosphate dehydrogenase [Alkalihalobacillus sp. CinArs1]